MDLLPFAQIDDFLVQEEIGALLDWVLANERRFAPAMTRVEDGWDVNESDRIALTLGDFGPLEQGLRRRIVESLPAFMAATGLSGDPPNLVELELAAHGDGAFYKPHIDIPAGEAGAKDKPEAGRVLSAVLYFHAEPKGFTGGELRLHRLGARSGEGGAFVDLQPIHNSLVLFHSWMPHEVRPVICPSRQFRSYRFAVNCWFRRRSAA